MLLATDNRIDAERVKDNDGGSVDTDERDSEDNVDGERVDTDEGGGAGDGDPKSLPCAALPRIDEVSWFELQSVARSRDTQSDVTRTPTTSAPSPAPPTPS